ncbi:hypothetical protein ACHAXN_010591 [Cyclotella atomus]
MGSRQSKPALNKRLSTMDLAMDVVAKKNLPSAITPSNQKTEQPYDETFSPSEFISPLKRSRID